MNPVVRSTNGVGAGEYGTSGSTPLAEAVSLTPVDVVAESPVHAASTGRRTIGRRRGAIRMRTRRV